MTTDYSNMNLKDLKKLLKSINITGVSKLNKKQILALLQQREMEEMKKKEEMEKEEMKKKQQLKKEVKLTELPLEKKQLAELKYLCKQNNLKGFSKMKKKEIVTLLQFFEEQNKIFVHPVHEVFSEIDDVVEPKYVLEKVSLMSLKKLAKQYKLKKYSKLNREELIELVYTRDLLTSTQKVEKKLKKKNMKDLKKLCKELSIKGYSKLNKMGIISKIVEQKDKVEVVEEEQQ